MCSRQRTCQKKRSTWQTVWNTNFTWKGSSQFPEISQLFWHGICSALEYGQEIARIMSTSCCLSKLTKSARMSGIVAHLVAAASFYPPVLKHGNGKSSIPLRFIRGVPALHEGLPDCDGKTNVVFCFVGPTLTPNGRSQTQSAGRTIRQSVCAIAAVNSIVLPIIMYPLVN